MSGSLSVFPPKWARTDLERSYAFDGERMTLTAPSTGDRYVELVWQRTGPA